jgi:hypothetical protein
MGVNERYVQLTRRSASSDKVCQIQEVNLADDGHSGFKLHVAEASRPGRQIKQNIRARKEAKKEHPCSKKPLGLAKYVNWHSPTYWHHIEAARQAAGWQMSASAIVKEAKRRDPIMFASLSHGTVWEWVDYSGMKPKWKDWVVKKVERGADPGHSKGG